jgi:hypothetical protein
MGWCGREDGGARNERPYRSPADCIGPPERVAKVTVLSDGPARVRMQQRFRGATFSIVWTTAA